MVALRLAVIGFIASESYNELVGELLPKETSPISYEHYGFYCGEPNCLQVMPAHGGIVLMYSEQNDVMKDYAAAQGYVTEVPPLCPVHQVPMRPQLNRQRPHTHRFWQKR